jgi:hypothetical protein
MPNEIASFARPQRPHKPGARLIALRHKRIRTDVNVILYDPTNQTQVEGMQGLSILPPAHPRWHMPVVPGKRMAVSA